MCSAPGAFGFLPWPSASALAIVTAQVEGSGSVTGQMKGGGVRRKACLCAGGPPWEVGGSTWRQESAPKLGGGGLGKTAQLTGPFISCYELWHRSRQKYF